MVKTISEEEQERRVGDGRTVCIDREYREVSRRGIYRYMETRDSGGIGCDRRGAGNLFGCSGRRRAGEHCNGDCVRAG